MSPMSCLPWKLEISTGPYGPYDYGCTFTFNHHHITPQPSYGPFSGTTRVSRCRKRTSGLYSAGKISRGRHTDHPAGYHSIRTNQCPPPPSPSFFTGRMPFLPPNQQCQSTEGKLTVTKLTINKKFQLLSAPKATEELGQKTTQN